MSRFSPSITHRDRRVVMIGGLAIAILVAARGVPAVTVWQTERAEHAAVTMRRLAFARIARQSLGAMRDTLTRRRGRLLALRSTLIAAVSPPAAAAMLGALLERIADEQNVKVTALQLRADTSSRVAMRRVAVRMTGETDVIGLAGLMAAVDGNDRTMVLSELSVSQPDPAAPDTKPETLHFDVVIEALALVEPGRLR